MKIVKCEMQKIALAALLLGVFSLSIHAKAEEPAEDDGLVSAARDGISLGDMKNLATGFNIRVVGDNIIMDGSIPKKCAIGASFGVSSTPAEGNKPGQHEIKINLNPDCLKMKPNERGPLVKLSSPALFGPSRSIADTNVDGKVCLMHAEDGPATCDAIPNAAYTSQATLNARALDEATKKQKAEEAAQAKRDREERDRKEKALVEKLNLLCKNGDFATFGAEVEAAKNLLGDVTSLLAKVDAAKKTWYAEQIKKAKDPEAIREAYENFLTAAGESGWDTTEVENVYANRSIDIMSEIVRDTNKTVDARQKAIRETVSALREIGALNKERKERVGQAYFNLAYAVREGAEGNREALAKAEKLYEAAAEFGDNAARAKTEAEIAKMYHEATEACIAEAKEKGKGFNQCDALAKKEKQHMNSAIKAQGRVKGDDSLEALAGMKQEKIARFGMDGFSMNMQGYGSFNRMGGSYDAGKYSAYQQSQQQFLMNMMMRQSMGAYGAQPAGGGESGGFFH